MREPRNRVVQVKRFGGPDELPTAGRGEVRVRVLASSQHHGHPPPSQAAALGGYVRSC